MSSLPFNPMLTLHNETLVAWQQACVHAAGALQPPPDPERLAKALALAHNGVVAMEDDGAALVTSGGTRYRVEADGTCHCPDAQHRGVPCKHTLAVHIHQQATAALAPSAAAPRAASPPPASPEDTRQERLPSADRWAVTEAPASACLRLRVGELEILYTMRDVSDAELTSRVQHLVPWVQDVLDQARERQALLDTLRQQREAASAGQTAVPQPPPPMPPADPQALIQQAVQQALAAPQPPSTGQTPANSTASAATPPASQADWCLLHQGPLEQRRHAKAAWYSPYGVHATKTCATTQGKGMVKDASTHQRTADLPPALPAEPRARPHTLTTLS